MSRVQIASGRFPIGRQTQASVAKMSIFTHLRSTTFASLLKKNAWFVFFLHLPWSSLARNEIGLDLLDNGQHEDLHQLHLQSKIDRDRHLLLFGKEDPYPIGTRASSNAGSSLVPRHQERRARQEEARRGRKRLTVPQESLVEASPRGNTRLKVDGGRSSPTSPRTGKETRTIWRRNHQRGVSRASSANKERPRQSDLQAMPHTREQNDLEDVFDEDPLFPQAGTELPHLLRSGRSATVYTPPLAGGYTKHLQVPNQPMGTTRLHPPLGLTGLVSSPRTSSQVSAQHELQDGLSRNGVDLHLQQLSSQGLSPLRPNQSIANFYRDLPPHSKQQLQAGSFPGLLKDMRAVSNTPAPPPPHINSHAHAARPVPVAPFPVEVGGGMNALPVVEEQKLQLQGRVGAVSTSPPGAVLATPRTPALVTVSNAPQVVPSPMVSNTRVEQDYSSTILCLGDSLTEGFNLPGWNQSPDLWVNKLASKLLHNLRSIHPIDIINAGNSGAISTIVTGRKPHSLVGPGRVVKLRMADDARLSQTDRLSAQSSDADLVGLLREKGWIPRLSSREKVLLTTIFFGTNEVGMGSFADERKIREMATNLNDIVDSAADFSDHVIVILPFVERHETLGAFYPSGWAQYKQLVLDHVATIQERQLNGKRVVDLVDLNDPRVSAFAAGGKFYTLKDPSGAHAHDRLHPSGEGHAVISDLVWNVFEKGMRNPKPQKVLKQDWSDVEITSGDAQLYSI
ncbi:unnamed protein product [Amoebophrya sp. A25]|nr:unnamed protein product [Amoebophrya sp. A25]|eukprot:GSA25T00010959001.1